MVDFEVNIKDKRVQFENLLNLNVPEENKFKIKKIIFSPKIEKFQFENFFIAKLENFSQSLSANSGGF